MQKNYSKIINNILFKNVSEKNFSSMIACLGSYDRRYNKNEIILNEGDNINFVGAVLEGAVKIIKTDYDGNEVIIAEVLEGDIFAEVFACAEICRSPVSIIASADSKVLFFDYRKIISTCSSSCMFHQQLIANMLNVIARKCLYLNRRIEVISKKTLREKILTYLYHESMGLEKFTISMKREELASFLCANRSALSNELSKMKEDGLIDYYKNEFKLVK